MAISYSDKKIAIWPDVCYQYDSQANNLSINLVETYCRKLICLKQHLKSILFMDGQL